MSVTSISEPDFKRLSERQQLELLNEIECSSDVTIGKIPILPYSILHDLYDVTRWYFEVGGDPNAKCDYKGESTSIFRMLMEISINNTSDAELDAKYVDLFLEYNVNIDGSILQQCCDRSECANVIPAHHITSLIGIHAQVRRLPNLYKYYKNTYNGMSLINTLYIYYSKDPSYERQFIEDILELLKCGFNPFSREESLMHCGDSKCKANHSLIDMLFTGGEIFVINGILPALDIKLNADILFDYSINSKILSRVSAMFGNVKDFLTTDSIKSIREMPTEFTAEKHRYITYIIKNVDNYSPTKSGYSPTSRVRDKMSECVICAHPVTDRRILEQVYGPKGEHNKGYTHNCTHYQDVCIVCLEEVMFGDVQPHSNCPICRTPCTLQDRIYMDFVIRLNSAETAIDNGIRDGTINIDLIITLSDAIRNGLSFDEAIAQLMS